MSEAYRDDREAVRVKIAKLQAELDQHRAKRFAVTELKEAVDAIAYPREIPVFLMLGLVALALLLAVSLSADIVWLSVILGMPLVAGICWMMWRYGRRILLPAADHESEEQKLIRFRIAEANEARMQLDDEQRAEIDEEERICTALSEEILQMRRLLDPSKWQ